MSDIELVDISLTLDALTLLEIDTFSVALKNEIAAMRIRGVSEAAIFQTLLADAERGGRVFGSLSAGIKSQMYGTISEAAAAGESQYYDDQGIDQSELEWMVVSKNPCQDCLDREGRKETADFWSTIGKPRSGVTICNKNCQCHLEPTGLHAPSTIILQ